MSGSALLRQSDLERRRYWLNVAIEDWDPIRRMVHCSNCLHAKVGGTPDDPTVRCAKGHGLPKELGRLIRPRNPVGFCSAETCPDFSSMDDGVSR